MNAVLASVHDILAGASFALALLFLKHSGEVKHHGFAWLGVGFGLYAVNHIGLPWLRQAGLGEFSVLVFAAGTGAVSLAALAIGIRHYTVPGVRPLMPSLLALVIASLLILILLLLIVRLNPILVHVVPASILGYGAIGQWRLQRKQPGMGYGAVAVLLSTHGITWVVLLFAGAERATATEILSIPYVAAGLTLLSITLTRSNRELRAARDTLASLNQSLEQRVQSRTAELEKANHQLHEWSFLDGLTQLANRRRFDDAIDREVSRLRQQDATLSLLLIDVDNFKLYNDHYGHLLGDECLRKLAAVFRAHAERVGDIAARYGGEEFAILLPGLSSQAALALAESIREAVVALKIPHQVTADSTIVTVSIGVATAHQSCSATRLLAHADAQLYAAKSSGKNCVRGEELSEQAPETDSSGSDR